jgi:hypothetical protein
MKANIPLSFNSIMEVDLSEIEDAVLFEELEERGFSSIEASFLNEFYESVRQKKNIQNLDELNTLFYNTLGRIL